MPGLQSRGRTRPCLIALLFLSTCSLVTGKSDVSWGQNPANGSFGQGRSQPGHGSHPPVHVSPSSPTTQPVNGFRPKLQLVQNQKQQQAPTIGLQDRIEQVVENSRLSFQPKEDLGQRRQLSNTQRIPQPAVVGRGDRMQARSVMESAVDSNRTRDLYPISQQVGLPSRQNSVQDNSNQEYGERYMTRPVAHRQTISASGDDEFSDQVHDAATALSIDELWADDLPAENQQGNIRWANRDDFGPPQMIPQSPSVLDWNDRQRIQAEANSRRPAQVPQGFDQSSYPRFRQDLDELEIGINQPANQGRDRLRSLIENRDDDNWETLDDQDSDSLLDRSCEYYRRQLLTTDIRDIALDISPPGTYADPSKKDVVSRQWTDRSGNIVASGTMVDMRRGYVILEDGQRLAYGRLGEADLLAISEYWNLPKVCGVENRGHVERYWHPMTYGYTASSLCHKPLYFEDIQLERYGHTHGPIMQPVHSVAHFFVRLAFLPYNTAIHPANECEYPLGLYRPGDCAPWLKEPVPLSLRGLGRQAAVYGAWIAILP